MRRSPWGGICVWQGTGDFWLLWGLLDCCWYKWQAVLLHTDWKHQALGVVSKWTVYCIVLWVSDHILDRRACDFKALNIDIRSILVFVHSVVWEQMLPCRVVTTCHFPWDLMQVHIPEFLAGIFPWAGNCIELQNGFILFHLPHVLHPHSVLSEMSIDEDSHSVVT